MPTTKNKEVPEKILPEDAVDISFDRRQEMYAYIQEWKGKNSLHLRQFYTGLPTRMGITIPEDSILDFVRELVIMLSNHYPDLVPELLEVLLALNLGDDIPE